MLDLLINVLPSVIRIVVVLLVALAACNLSAWITARLQAPVWPHLVISGVVVILFSVCLSGTTPYDKQIRHSVRGAIAAAGIGPCEAAAIAADLEVR